MSKLTNEKLNNLQYIIADVIAGDDEAGERSEVKVLNKKQLDKALNFLLNNPDIDDKQRAYLITNSWRLIYRDKPPSVDEFLTKDYLGFAADRTWDRIKQVFREFMDPTKPYRHLILYPHIGWGKSYLSNLITMYISIHLSMMKNPFKYMGLNPASLLCQLLVSFSLKKSSELLLEPLQALLEGSPFFEKVHTREGMIRRDKEWQNSKKVEKIYWTTASPTSNIHFSNGSHIKLVSNTQNILGLSVVTGTMSELAFFREAGKDDEWIMKLFTDLKERIDSRMHGNYFGRSILDSSPNTLESPIDNYIVNDARKDKTNYVVQGAVWDWNKVDYDMSQTFKVFKGARGQPPKILDNEDLKEYDVTEIIDVPLSLKQKFIDSIYNALKNQAGIPAGSADKIFYDHTKIETIFDPQMKNVYTYLTAPIEREPQRLLWDQVSPMFFKTVAGKYQFYYKPWLPRVFAVDQSIAHDVTSIAVMHLERKKGTTENMFVVDFTIPVAPQGSRINLDAIKYFIEDLRNIGNLALFHGSFDQFQSESSIQYLKSKGFEVERLSVDISMDPYLHFVSLVESGRIIMGRNIFMKNNLKSLKIVKSKEKGKMKIDHEASMPVIVTGETAWEKSMIGYYAKDVSDSVAACCELLRRYGGIGYEEFDHETLVKLTDPEEIKKEALSKTDDFLKNKGFRI